MNRLESDYYDYMGFDPETTRTALQHYVPYFAGCAPVVELASGRGEFLGLLKAAGVAAYGVDNDDGMVERTRAAGVDVVFGDAVTHLAEQVEPGTVGGVFTAHFLEHLAPVDVERVVAGVRRALRSDGVFVAVVPNAACVPVLCHDFWKDPTHVRFYDPQLIAFFCARAGLTVEHVGGNPANAPGPYPGLAAAVTTVQPSLADAIHEVTSAAAAGAGRRRGDPDSPWFKVGHLLTVLDERLRRTQHELAAVRAAYANLLAALFPPNEVYVVARG